MILIVLLKYVCSILVIKYENGMYFVPTWTISSLYYSLSIHLCLCILQINLPDSVTERFIHSLSTFIMGPYCVWLIVVGGGVNDKDDTLVKDPNITMLVELGK